MTWIKICGTTNLEDARLAVDAGADALGFVFYENSPRKVSPEVVRQIIAELPAGVEKVGVFVRPPFDFMEDVAERTGLTAVQLYPDFPAEPATDRPRLAHLKHYLVLPARLFLDQEREFESSSLPAGYRVNGILVDSGTPQQPGGTGRVFDWEKGRHVVGAIRASGFNVIAAGGLTPDNVTEAIRALEPWGVDVVSGVEASPGKKNPEKVRAFITAVRQSEKIV
ncbi:MAG TPA: phosphoribosylanthranilate isomerase [Terriglobales bacterium]|nr:phosphoribosylanthranilate isomerase [Terriglobales bacterium]